MKRILIIAVIAFAALASAAQTDSSYVDDYGFSALEVIRVENDGTNTDTTFISFEFLNFVYRKTSCHVEYNKYFYNKDTVKIRSEFKQVPVPMSDMVGGKAIGDYLNEFYSPTDTARIKALFKYMRRKNIIGE